MRPMLISVAMCTYQGARFLKDQLDSLVFQSYRPLEIVIRDDHSSDGTWEIVQDYHSRYPELIRCFRNDKCLGVRTNFELVFKDCKGDLIAPCDQDDIWHPQKLKLMSARISNHLLIYHDSELIDGSAKSLERKVSQRYSFIKGNDPAALLLFNCVSGHSILFKKSLLDYALPFPNVGYYDHWLAMVAASKGSIDYMEEPLVLFRQHAENASGYDKRPKHRKNYSEAKIRMERENLWIRACKEIHAEQSVHRLESQISDLAKSRETKFFIPELGWAIWKNRKRLLAIFPDKTLKHFSLAIRYTWGLKIKKLIY